jgi:hypothetical protein
MRSARYRVIGLLVLLVLLGGCGSGSPAATDAGATDATTGDAAVDTAAHDATAHDASGDAAAGDGAVTFPLAGFGAISGACGVITTADLTAATPRLVQDTLDFGTTAYSAAHLGELSAGGQHMIADDNLGGSSLISEVFAYEVLYRCELATLLKTEKEIGYADGGTKKTDFLVAIDGLKLGVSVVRAYVYPGTTPIDVAQATTELTGKLADIALSTAYAAPEDAWVKQILAVIAYNAGDAAAVATAWSGLAPSVQGDTIVVVTQTDGADAPLYQ